MPLSGHELGFKHIANWNWNLIRLSRPHIHLRLQLRWFQSQRDLKPLPLSSAGIQTSVGNSEIQPPRSLPVQIPRTRSNPRDLPKSESKSPPPSSIYRGSRSIFPPKGDSEYYTKNLFQSSQPKLHPPFTMLPSQGPNDQPQGAGSFEDRVRNLLLSNGSGMNSSTPPDGSPTLSGQRLPPHMLRPTQQGQENNGQSVQPPSLPTGGSNQTSPVHKRPNQAQRRQMNSQLSIPIDARPVHGTQAGRGSGSGSGSRSGTFSPQIQGQWPNSAPPHMHQNQRYNNHHQQYSPRFQNGLPNSPYSPYSPRSPFPQASPGSPMTPYQPGPSPQFQSRSGPNTFQNQSQQNPYSRPPPQNRQLYQPGSNMGGRGRPHVPNPGEVSNQGAELERLLLECVPGVGIGTEEEAEKEAFRAVIESVCRTTIAEYEIQELANNTFDKSSVEVQCFGSMQSGFATKASDMDLALISPRSAPAPDSPDSVIPRLLEKKLLDLGYGARLLTRTRVPIIKLCQNPTEKLLSLLREERIKWENGFVTDGDDEQMDAHSPIIDSSEGSATIVTTASQRTPEKAPAKGASPPQEGLPAKEATRRSRSPSLLGCTQREGQSLGDYYNTIKRHLRKAGGRDITPTAPDINEVECKILNEVCKKFIAGLADSVLATRLRNYMSILPLFDSSLPLLQRTLHGIFLQIEGEKLALGWEHRTVTEPNEKQEADGAEAVNSWRALQDKNGPFVESLLYNRQLSAACDRLKRLDSLRLISLEQMFCEDPVSYYGRAQRIMQNLRVHQTMPGETNHHIVVKQYISGISHYDIAQELQYLADNNSPSGVTLKQIGLHHRILQLAGDYEHALRKGMYAEFDDADREYVKSYIGLLRAMKLQDKHLPNNEVEAMVVKKIRSLPDPTQISTNKPRDRYQDHLEFPKSGVGIQCDINFSAQLAIHNTLLLRCYSHCDPRVKPMILFVKNWAKLRGINTPYRGTLSSYGYVLMVLHYLVNIATPFVLPNLQDIKKEPPPYLSPQEIEARSICKGRDVRFWRNEMEIKDLAARKMLNHNHESIGLLLRGFFEYYAQNGQMSTAQGRGFDWGREVLSLRTIGGILTKQEKGWTGAKTTIETSVVAAPPLPSTAKPLEPGTNAEPLPFTDTQEIQTPKLHSKIVEETKEVRHRYLFAIEDPFELDHNVARTVTHNGIVSIRDEFRRAWRIIKGTRVRADGASLLEPVTTDDCKSEFLGLLDLIHGRETEAYGSNLNAVAETSA